MGTPFEKHRDVIVDQDEQQDVAQLEHREEQEPSLVEKLGDQPEQVDVHRNREQDDGDEDVHRQPEIDVAEPEIAARVKEHHREKDDAEKPEKDVREDVIFPDGRHNRSQGHNPSVSAKMGITLMHVNLFGCVVLKT
jgi:hypothetical protein